MAEVILSISLCYGTETFERQSPPRNNARSARPTLRCFSAVTHSFSGFPRRGCASHVNDREGFAVSLPTCSILTLVCVGVRGADGEKSVGTIVIYGVVNMNQVLACD